MKIRFRFTTKIGYAIFIGIVFGLGAAEFLGGFCRGGIIGFFITAPSVAFVAKIFLDANDCS